MFPPIKKGMLKSWTGVTLSGHSTSISWICKSKCKDPHVNCCVLEQTFAYTTDNELTQLWVFRVGLHLLVSLVYDSPLLESSTGYQSGAHISILFLPSLPPEKNIDTWYFSDTRFSSLKDFLVSKKMEQGFFIYIYFTRELPGVALVNISKG